MTTKESVDPANPVAEKVLKICLIISTALGVIITVLRLISGENLIHAVSNVFPLISILAVFYVIVISRRRAGEKH
jgi:membrane-associated PAP2 superfamily phosphatase